MSSEKAILALADGSSFLGRSLGVSGEVSGEVVFNTSLTGYQEILTDPSYAKQIVTLTYPHIGNTGTNSEDMESQKIWASALVIKDLPLKESSWRRQNHLREFLSIHNTICIAQIDTRKLTRLIRTKGAQSAAIITGKDSSEKRAIELARSFSGLLGLDLAKEVSTSKKYQRCGDRSLFRQALLIDSASAADEEVAIAAGGGAAKRNRRDPSL